MQGPHLLVFLNNSAIPVIDYTDNNSPLLTGKTGLRIYNASVVFKNVVIKAGNKTILTNFKASINPQVSAAWDAIQTNSTGSFKLDSFKAFNGRQAQIIQYD